MERERSQGGILAGGDFCVAKIQPHAPNVRARHRDGIVIEHSGYQLHIITDIPPDTVVSELTRLFLDVFANPN